MRYYIQRYCHGLWRIRQWLPLVFLPPVVYLLVVEQRTFWRSDRLLLGILAGALMLWFILAGFVELADPSFKSERQISRYLDLPVIGVMPDLNPLVRRLQPKT
jgi:hypothetical protein